MKQKIIAPLLVASIAGSAAVVAVNNVQQITAHANAGYIQDNNITDIVGNTVEISGFVGKGEIGVPFSVPSFVIKDRDGNDVTASTTPTISVTDPSGRKLTTTGDSIEFNGSEFTPKARGYYTINFETNVAGQLKTFIEPLRVYVSGLDYALRLPKNSKYVVPSEVPASASKELLIPVPQVFLGDEEINAFDENLSGNLEVSIVPIGSSTLEETKLTVDSSEEFFKWIPQIAGNYEIVYKYIDGTVQDYVTKRITVKPASELDISKIELNFAYASTRPTTAVLGVKTTLPEITATDRVTGKSMEVFANIKVVHIGTGQEMVVENFAFTPTQKGNYRVTYKAENNYFGISSFENSFIIENVKDSQAPTVFAVNNYTISEDKTRVETVTGDVAFAWDDNKTEEENLEALDLALGNLAAEVPSVAIKGAEVVFPAAFGKDNVTTVGNLTITRSVRYSATGGVTQLTGNFNESVKHTFEVAGNYTVRYIIRDEAGNERTQTYDLTVFETLSELNNSSNVLKTPTLSLSANQTLVDTDSKITFNLSTQDEHDSRVRVRAFYTLGNEDDSTKIEITTKNDANQYVLDLSKVSNIAGETKVNIIAEAYNDYNATPATRRVSVNLIDVSPSSAPLFTVSDFLADLVAVSDNNIVDSDNNSVVLNNDGFYFDASLNDYFEPFSQKDVITLPSVEISDDNASNLSFVVSVRDPFGQRINVTNSQNLRSGNTFTISGGKFVANHAGVYTINYVAKDASNNMSVKSVGVRVRDTEKPTIELSSYDPFINEVQVGQFVEVPRASIRDNGVLLDDSELTEGVVEAGKAGFRWYLKESNLLGAETQRGFAPAVAGNYVVVYEAWDANGNTTESRAYTVVAKDTLKPVLELEKGDVLRPKYELGDVVTLPAVVNYYDGVEGKGLNEDFVQTPKEDLQLKVVVTDANGNEIKDVEEVVVTTSGDAVLRRYTLTPVRRSTYTVKYIVTDAVGNRTEEVRSFIVGDVVAPTHSWIEDYEMIENAKVGQEFYLDLETSSEFSDDEDALDDIIRSVALYNPRGSRVTSRETDANRWVFEEVGVYELRVVVTDSAGNSDTVVYKINVTDSEGETNIIDEWLGVTLIIATSVILAGVVIYFVVTTKTASSASSKKTRRSNKK